VGGREKELWGGGGSSSWRLHGMGRRAVAGVGFNLELLGWAIGSCCGLFSFFLFLPSTMLKLEIGLLGLIIVLAYYF
jgi:hypothetical protein